MTVEDLAPAWFLPDGEKPYPGIILGTDLCAMRRQDGSYSRYCYRGEKVQVTFVPFSFSGTIKDATGMPSKLFRYVDDARTGVYDIDSMSVYIDYGLAQKVLEMGEQTRSDESGGDTVPPRTTQVQIKLKPGVDPLAARDLVEKTWEAIRDRYIIAEPYPELLNHVEVQTWEQKQARFIAAVEKDARL